MKTPVFKDKLWENAYRDGVLTRRTICEVCFTEEEAIRDLFVYNFAHTIPRTGYNISMSSRSLQSKLTGTKSYNI